MLEAPATITLVGTVDPVRRSQVGSEIAGIVAEMLVRQGDYVPAGGVICKLNDDTLRLQLDEAKARLSALKARHEELLAGTRKEELVRLKALADEAAADYERWTFEMRRVEKLYEDSDSNAKELYDTRADYLRAERRKIAVQAAYDLGVEGPRKEVIAGAAYEVSAQQAVVDRIESDLRKTAIRAPFAGHIVERSVEEGEWIAVGGQAVEMVDLATVLVRVDAPESAMPHLAIEMAARVSVDALKRSFEGKIKHLIRQADLKARTFPVEIEVDNRDGLLAAGMFARTTVPAGPKVGVVAVPKDAIVEREGIRYVAIVVPGQQGGMAGILTGVTTGADVKDWIAITSGNIQPGMRVITRGNENMLPFPTPIQIVDEKGVPVAMPDGATSQQHREGT
jgi:multidrug efflux pump subunit AcrA (membrane-fusion protein)